MAIRELIKVFGKDPKPQKPDWRENPTLQKAFDIRAKLIDALQTYGNVDTGTIWTDNENGVHIYGKAKTLGVPVRATDPNSPIVAEFSFEGIQTSVSFPDSPDQLPKVKFTQPTIIQQPLVDPILDALARECFTPTPSDPHL